MVRLCRSRTATRRFAKWLLEEIVLKKQIGTMQYHIKLIQSDEGWAVSCPALPGCHSQGTTRDDAVENIKVAIQEWLEVESEESGLRSVEESVVTV